MKTTGTVHLAEMMKEYGVTHVFLLPSILSPSLARMEELGIQAVAGHSEVAVSYMADGFARAGRRPGIAMCQTVGGANLAAGLREPFLASSPVIAITGGPMSNNRYRHLYQQVEDMPMFDPVTKFNGRVDDIDRLPDMLRQAFRAATTGAPGPVHLEIAGQHGEVIFGEADLQLLAEPQFGACPPFRPEPETPLVQKAVGILNKAQRPVIIAGGGVVTSGGEAELVKLAELLSVPVATSLNGKGIIPENHPLSAGLMGTYGRWSANQTVAEADLVFFVGSQAGGHVTANWKAPEFGVEVIHCDINPEELGRNYPARVGLLGDAKATLQKMLDMATPSTGRPAWLGRVQALKQEWWDTQAAQFNSEAMPIRPERICREIAAILPPDAVLVADTGHSAQWTGCLVELCHPGQRFIRCAGTLGWGFPASLGVKCALPDRPVLAFVGDAALYYHVSELETAARLGIKTVTIVNNNASWGQTSRGIRHAFGGQTTSRGRGVWQFKQTDFVTVAEGMGCVGFRVEKPGDIREALEQAFAADGPALIEIRTDIDARPTPPWR